MLDGAELVYFLHHLSYIIMCKASFCKLNGKYFACMKKNR